MLLVIFNKFMQENLNDVWFQWFYKKWEKYSPGELIDNGLKPAQIAERFVNDNEKDLLEIAKKFDLQNFNALEEFVKLSESELHIFIYFLKLIKLKNTK